MPSKCDFNGLNCVYSSYQDESIKTTLETSNSRKCWLADNTGYVTYRSCQIAPGVR